jgi:hypothetical protein
MARLGKDRRETCKTVWLAGVGVNKVSNGA